MEQNLGAIDVVNSGKFRMIVIELYKDGLLTKTKTFFADIKGLHNAVRYILSLQGKGKYKLVAVFKFLSTRGGKCRLDNGKYIKWYYLP